MRRAGQSRLITGTAESGPTTWDTTTASLKGRVFVLKVRLGSHEMRHAHWCPMLLPACSWSDNRRCLNRDGFKSGIQPLIFENISFRPPQPHEVLRTGANL